MFLGSAGFGYVKYIIGSFAGVLPGMIATTVMGANIKDPTSPEFWIAVGSEVVFAAASTLIYYNYKKKKKSEK